MICDRSFDEDGSFLYPSRPHPAGQAGGRGRLHGRGPGDAILVNGAPWPVLEVDAARYRLPLLNASNARRYELALDPPADTVRPDRQRRRAARRAVGHGRSPSPQAERFDVVVDFSGTRSAPR